MKYFYRSRSNRYVTVYKNEGSTIVQADAVFGFCRASQQHTINLLQRHGVNAKEKQELLPPTERDRLLGQECKFLRIYSNIFFKCLLLF